MTQNKIKKIHRWYGWCLAAVLAALGILLVLSCLAIYRSGPRPYSAESIALKFRSILIPVMIGLVGVIGGIGLNLLLPVEHARAKGITAPEDVMLRLRKKADIPPVQKEIRLRCILRIVTALCFSALMVYPLVYFLTPEHFSVSDLNADIIQAVLIALIPAAVGLLLCWLCRIFVNASFSREVSVYRKALAEGHRNPSEKPTTQLKKSPSVLTSVRMILLSAAIIFVVIGILNGGAEDVLKKAIAICTECIGLG